MGGHIPAVQLAEFLHLAATQADSCEQRMLTRDIVPGTGDKRPACCGALECPALDVATAPTIITQSADRFRMYRHLPLSQIISKDGHPSIPPSAGTTSYYHMPHNKISEDGKISTGPRIEPGTLPKYGLLYTDSALRGDFSIHCINLNVCSPKIF